MIKFNVLCFRKVLNKIVTPSNLLNIQGSIAKNLIYKLGEMPPSTPCYVGINMGLCATLAVEVD